MKKEKITDSRLLTRAEVAEIFQVAPSTITRWAEAGKLPTAPPPMFNGAGRLPFPIGNLAEQPVYSPGSKMALQDCGLPIT